MKKKLLALVLVFIMAFAATTAAYATTTYTVEVSGCPNGLHLRDIETREIITTLRDGTQLVVYSRKGANLITRWDGQPAYIWLEGVKVVAHPKKVVATAVSSPNGNVVMRSEPTSDASQLAVLEPVTPVEITGKTNRWYEVKYQGRTGYIADHLIRDVKPVASTDIKTSAKRQTVRIARTIPIYSDSSCKVKIGTARAGAVATVLWKSNGVAKLQARNGKTCYARYTTVSGGK